MRTTITIPDERLEDLLEIIGTSNRTEAINEAIERVIRHAKIERLLSLRGKVDIASNDQIEAWDDGEYRGG